jgi:ABC-type dipeptide/oligopeptide/nickel transport system permease component
MAVPWVLVGLPIAAIALWLTAGGTLDNLDAPFVRTAAALDLGRGRVVGHAARPTYGASAAGLGAQVRALVFNIMFVEYTFFLPRLPVVHQARDRQRPAAVDRVRRQHARGRGGVVGRLVVALSLLADVATLLLDPRISARSA